MKQSAIYYFAIAIAASATFYTPVEPPSNADASPQAPDQIPNGGVAPGVTVTTRPMSVEEQLQGYSAAINSFGLEEAQQQKESLQEELTSLDGVDEEIAHRETAGQRGGYFLDVTDQELQEMSDEKKTFEDFLLRINDRISQLEGAATGPEQ